MKEYPEVIQKIDIAGNDYIAEELTINVDCSNSFETGTAKVYIYSRYPKVGDVVTLCLDNQFRRYIITSIETRYSDIVVSEISFSLLTTSKPYYERYDFFMRRHFDKLNNNTK